MTSREWADKDYYADLGVSSSATPKEIKKAYRKIARENHPDAKPGDKAAEERFKRAAEAYDVLGDESERKQYDEFKALMRAGGGFRGFGGKGGPGFPGGFRQETRDFNVSDLFGSGGQAGFSTDGPLGDILGGIFNRGGAARRPTAPARGANVETEISLDFSEAILGTSLPLELTRKIRCADCSGSGSATGAPERCPDCQGTGIKSEERGHFGMSVPCPRCGGSGTMITKPCRRCGGSGTVTTTKSLTIKIPTGVADGKKLRIKGQGEAGPHGTPAGDLLVTVHVRPDPLFTREGNNLAVTVPVSFAELALGSTLTVPTLESTVRVKVPAGTPDGRTMRVRGKGVPGRGSHPAGDLLVTVQVAVPKNLDAGATSALRTYAQAEKDAGFSPRAGWAGNRR